MAAKRSTRVPSVRAAGYVRLSVMTEETTSLETQAREIARYCEARGWRFDPATDLFEDRNLSGSKRSVRRPRFDDLMASLDWYDRVVVWKLDRFTRRLAELTEAMESLDVHGVALVSVSEGIDTSTVPGKTMTGIVGTLAQSEALTIADRVRVAQATMARTGRWKGGNRPYGWNSKRLPDGTGVRLVLDRTEAKVLREAVALAKRGEGPGPIAKALNAKGYRSSKGNPWSPQAIRGILLSPLMVGWHEFNGVITRDSNGLPLVAHEPLITEEEWHQVRAALAQRREVRPQTDGAMLSGVIYCALCGGRMNGSSSTTNPKANYKCRNRYALNKTETCRGTSVKALVVDQLIGEVVIEILSRTRSRQKALTGLSKSRTAARDERRSLESREATILMRMEALREDRGKGLYDYDGGHTDWQTDFGRARDQLNEVRAKLDNLVEEVEVISPAVLDQWLKAKDIHRMWEKRTNSQRREVVRALIERIEIGPADPTWRHRHFDTSRVVIAKWRGQT